MVTRLKELREARLVTQEELAVRAQIGRATIARIESGSSAPSFGTLRKLAAALEVDPQELIADAAAYMEARRRAPRKSKSPAEEA